MRVFVCVRERGCVRVKEREREREKEREREIHTQRQTDRERESERERSGREGERVLLAGYSATTWDQADI